MEIEEVITRYNKYFQYFSDQEINLIQRNSLVRNYRKRQVLYSPGDSRSHLYLLNSGTIRIEKSDINGEFMYLQFIPSDELFPLIGLFYDETYTFSAIAQTDIEVVIIPVKFFEQLLSNNAKQLVKYLQIQSEALKTKNMKIQKGIISNTYDRVITSLAILFSDLAERNQRTGEIELASPVTITDISTMSGTTRETTSSIIKQLVQSKLIRYNHKRLIFLDSTFFVERLTN
ncbi:Crp/Fnr family transcriptional regulator [Tetragenococcus halophilus]|uniref:Crp/Fnr family transcriptional regulator n=1 Tax=Tetragenococcus halophilus TaxID=51669 RepID=UPI00083CD165|nr:Crp/Fnr family transcriptional regulator [Tetragenococcus halophilus]AOF49877.1 Crp/Fnr family transcriptional regulator [Tetragenococcus halophilus]MCF1685973.1 Crp/Fnr family transcriptional regulator [Tetragenococcus halophilus]MCO8284757.1 Crp/Fnr family transcriptional regulator [Tetragenococcus halophilus]MCO8294161.1 Crp/Fnr family transcriptional regulator [Tetragenococcus halophilus]GBD66236.1 arginine deiminase pathway regulator [Tetragenococcus halophilus subsp. halophilus]